VLPVGLEDVSAYPRLFAELVQRGWTDTELAALACRNVLRVLRQAQQASQTLSASEPASTLRFG
jgi:membrane dipeptidase